MVAQLFAQDRLRFLYVGRKRDSHLGASGIRAGPPAWKPCVLKKITPAGAVGCVVPLHPELALGTLRGILKQAGITPDEFVEASG